MKSRPADGVLLGGLLLFVAGLCLVPSTESDLFFRLRVGQEILARRGLLGRNEFSFTHPQHPDLDLAWAFEVLLALVFRAGGFGAIVAVKTAIVLGAVAAAYHVARRSGAAPIAATVALASAALVMSERLVERPHVMSFVGESALLAITVGQAAQGAAWTWRRFALVLPPFAAGTVLWANMHAGVFVAPALLALAALGAALAHRGPESARAAIPFVTLAVVAAAAALVTPVGIGVVRYLALHVTLPRVHPVDEFRTVTWRSDAAYVVYLGASVLAVVASTPNRAALRRALPLLLPCLGAAVLGLTSVRFAPDAALVIAPLLAVSLTGLASRWPLPQLTRLPSAATLTVSAALVAAALGPRVAAAAAGRPFFALGVDLSALPLEGLRFVDRNGLRERMYNDFEVGSYLIFEGYPRHRVFVDPRLPAYPQAMHRLLGRFDHDAASWGQAMDAYRVESALLAYAGVNRRVAWWDPERWALVFRAADTRVFVRRAPHWRSFIAAHEIPATFTFTLESGAHTVPLYQQPAASPIAACEWQRRLGDLLIELDRPRAPARLHYERALADPGCLEPHEEAKLASWLAIADVGAGKRDAAVLQRLERVLRLSPEDTWARAARARVYEDTGRLADARADWARVAREATESTLRARAAERARAGGPGLEPGRR